MLEVSEYEQEQRDLNEKAVREAMEEIVRETDPKFSFPLYVVTFSGRDRYRGEDYEKAIRSFVLASRRKCTSCGQPGCDFDLNPRRTLLIEPLPEERRGMVE